MEISTSAERASRTEVLRRFYGTEIVVRIADFREAIVADYTTIFGSLEHYRQGEAEIISGNVKHYAFSNIFAVASKSAPYEKVVVGKNLEYVIEAVRAEGTSPWFACSHDEFVIDMDGEVTIEFVKLANPNAVAPRDREGTVAVNGTPEGQRMGTVSLKRGHQALLPAGAAYRFIAARPGVLIMQTIFGALSVEKWAEICMQPQEEGVLA